MGAMIVLIVAALVPIAARSGRLRRRRWRKTRTDDRDRRRRSVRAGCRVNARGGGAVATQFGRSTSAARTVARCTSARSSSSRGGFRVGRDPRPPLPRRRRRRVDCALSPCRLTFDVFDGPSSRRRSPSTAASDRASDDHRRVRDVDPRRSQHHHGHGSRLRARRVREHRRVRVDRAIRCLGGMGPRKPTRTARSRREVPSHSCRQGPRLRHPSQPLPALGRAPRQHRPDRRHRARFRSDLDSTGPAPLRGAGNGTSGRAERRRARSGLHPRRRRLGRGVRHERAEPGGCRFLTNAATGHDGALETEVAVRRRVGDRRLRRRRVRAARPPSSRSIRSTSSAFDASIPPPPVPSVTVEPSTGLVDRQVVDVQLHDVEPGSFVDCSCARSANPGARRRVPVGRRYGGDDPHVAPARRPRRRRLRGDAVRAPRRPLRRRLRTPSPYPRVRSGRPVGRQRQPARGARERALGPPAGGGARRAPRSGDPLVCGSAPRWRPPPEAVRRRSTRPSIVAANSPRRSRCGAACRRQRVSETPRKLCVLPCHRRRTRCGTSADV